MVYLMFCLIIACKVKLRKICVCFWMVWVILMYQHWFHILHLMMSLVKVPINYWNLSAGFGATNKVINTDLKLKFSIGIFLDWFPCIASFRRWVSTVTVCYYTTCGWYTFTNSKYLYIQALHTFVFYQVNIA